MRKIPTLFVRDPDDPRRLLRDVNPGCEWVTAGEGVATRKYDGTCVMFDGEEWWARREVKPGKTPPPDFVAVETDPNTGKTVGWEPAEQSSFAKVLASADPFDSMMGAGTYELCGPKVNGNPEGFERHVLVPHGQTDIPAPRDFEGLRDWLADAAIEGVVWHHPDGRMCKIKRRDFPRVLVEGEDPA